MAYTALVAEDEELIREIAVELLRDAGFIVLEAAHAEEALQHLRAPGATIHLLFTDIQMPGTMDGLTLAKHTKSDWPGIAIPVRSHIRCP